MGEATAIWYFNAEAKRGRKKREEKLTRRCGDAEGERGKMGREGSWGLWDAKSGGGDGTKGQEGEEGEF
jgi:hypothetical protein